jgi:Fe-S oxidoreductase
MNVILTEEKLELVKKCSTCHDQCMAYTQELKFLPRQAYVTSRKAQLLDFIERDLVDMDLDAAEVIYSALNSGLQKENCIFAEGIDEAEYIREARAAFVRQGIIPEPIKQLLMNAQKGSVYGENMADLPRIEGNGEVALVFDGASRLLTPGAREAACTVFKRLEKNGTIIDISSCGYIERDLGFMEESEQALQEFLQLLQEQYIKKIISIDPAVVLTLRNQSGIESLHFSEFINSFELNISPLLSPSVVVYHDSSEMGRYLHITEAPRRFLKKISGVDYREFSFHHEQAKPTGGKFGYLHLEESRVLAQERLEEAKQIGADIIITASPFSYANLSSKRNSVKIMDFSEIVDVVLKEGV